MFSLHYRNAYIEGNTYKILSYNRIKCKNKQCQASVYLHYVESCINVILHRSQLTQTLVISTNIITNIRDEVKSDDISLFISI